METGTQVRDLIEQQTQAWRSAVAGVVPMAKGDRVLLVGSGTSYYLAKAAQEFGRRQGYDIEARPSGDLVLEPDLYLRGIGLVVVISRSGTTSEALWALDAANTRGVATVAVSCHADSPLAQTAKHAFVAPEGEDDTVVMIRSFSSMLLLLQASFGADVGPTLAWDSTNLIASVKDAVGHWRSVPRRVYLLGSGVREGIADEGALKIQEMSGVAAYAYSPLEFRHGPRGSVTAEDLVVLLGQTRFADYEWEVLADLARQGPMMWTVAKPSWFAGRDSSLVDHAVELPESVADEAAGPMAIMPLQWLGRALALAYDRDPDRPLNLTAVVSIAR